MSEQDKIASEKTYDLGVNDGLMEVFPGNNEWPLRLDERERFDRFKEADQIQSPSRLEVFNAGERRGAAIGLNLAVHRLYGDENPYLPGDTVTDVGGSTNAASEIAKFVENARSAYKDQDVQALWREPAVKEVFPEIVMAELYNNFDLIHDVRAPGGITRQELQTFADHCGEEKGLNKLVVDYALQHFDKMRHLDGDSTDITKSALEQGQKLFIEAEKARASLDGKRWPDETVLHFLNDNFDKIRDPRFPGISQLDLRRYFSKNCDENLEQVVMGQYYSVKDLDPADGDRNWYSLGFARYNSDDITRSDVTTGLNSIANDRNRSQAIKSLFADWSS